MCDKIKVFKLYLKYLHLYLITALAKVIAIVFVFENFIVLYLNTMQYMYLDPSLICIHIIQGTRQCLHLYLTLWIQVLTIMNGQYNFLGGQTSLNLKVANNLFRILDWVVRNLPVGIGEAR